MHDDEIAAQHISRHGTEATLLLAVSKLLSATTTRIKGTRQLLGKLS